MKSKKILAGLLLSAIATTPLMAQNASATRNNTSVNAAAPAIRITPPAPKFSDAERHAELAKRRQQVAEKVGKNGILVLYSAEPKIYTNDVDYEFRQENNLYYLTMLRQPGAYLVIAPGNAGATEILFLPKRVPEREVWNGYMYSREDATRLSGIKTILDASEFQPFMDALKKKQAFASPSGVSISAPAENLFLLLPRASFDENGMREFAQENNIVKDFAKVTVNEQNRVFSYEPTAGYKIQNAYPIFSELRLVKSPMEQRFMQHAIDITIEGFGRAMGVVGRAKFEYEVEAEIDYTFKRRNADFWGYPSIVGCGPNATTLHYIESQGAVKPGDLLLMDVGAEYEHYTADVTRTYPVSGKFTKEQAEIYQIVYDAQEAAARATKPGAIFSRDVHNAAAEVIKQGLFKLGLTTGLDAVAYKMKFPNGQEVAVPQWRVWFMHGTSHWLGMNVHDVGGGNVPLKPGMIFTNEPGIYIRGDALDYLPADQPEAQEFKTKIRAAFEKYKNIGVRIEDDMLVTETGVEWMSKALPRTIKDIEDFMARASKEMQAAAFDNERAPKSAVLFDASANLLFSNNSVNLFNNELFGGDGFATGRTVRRGHSFIGNAQAFATKDHHGHSHTE